MGKPPPKRLSTLRSQRCGDGVAGNSRPARRTRRSNRWGSRRAGRRRASAVWAMAATPTSGSLEADDDFTIPRAAERVGSVPRRDIATGRREERARTGRSVRTGQDEMALEREQATARGAKASPQRAVRHSRRVVGAPVPPPGAINAVCDSTSGAAFLSIGRSRRNLHEPQGSGRHPACRRRRHLAARLEAAPSGRQDGCRRGSAPVHDAEGRPKREVDTPHE